MGSQETQQVETGRDTGLKVVHCKKEPYDVYIGRPSKWGNPFVIGMDGPPERVINKYREWILNQPKLLSEIHELKGKVLGCWCKPKPCHGDVLIELIAQLPPCSDMDKP